MRISASGRTTPDPTAVARGTRIVPDDNKNRKSMPDWSTIKHLVSRDTSSEHEGDARPLEAERVEWDETLPTAMEPVAEEVEEAQSPLQNEVEPVEVETPQPRPSGPVFEVVRATGNRNAQQPAPAPGKLSFSVDYGVKRP
jgi:hypothetical protein